VRLHGRWPGTKENFNVSKATRAQALRLEIELWHLPAYSPNLNLIERACKVMNEQVRDNIYFSDAKIFVHAIKDFFVNQRLKLKSSLKTRFAENFQVLKKTVFEK
jgi:DDE superfamily endonuclease